MVLLRPDSRGRLDLIDADPATPPRLDPAYLSAATDLSRLIDGYQAARTIARTAPLASMIGEPLLPLPRTRTEIADFLRATATTVFHPVGTCRIGRADDEMAVVDAALRVRGGRSPAGRGRLGDPAQPARAHQRARGDDR